MDTQKATYWFALALFGLVLHMEYQRGAFPMLHRLAGCAGATVHQLTTNGERAYAAARFFSGTSTAAVDDRVVSTEARELANAQAELAHAKRELIRDQVRAQMQMVREQVDLQRAQIDQIRQRAHIDLRSIDLSSIDLSNVGHSRALVLHSSNGCTHRVGQVAIASAIDLDDNDSYDNDEDSF